MRVDEFKQAHGLLRPGSKGVGLTCLDALEALPCHGLQDEIEAPLDNRVEAKYLMPMEVLPLFLPALAEEFSVLQIAGEPVSTYEVTYFDTPERELYHAHHNGRRRRQKYRLRRYAETDTSFLEIKLKGGAGRTIKQRIPWDSESSANRQIDPQLAREMERFEPVLLVNYRRMSFWNRDSGDRLTLDIDLRFQRLGAAAGVCLPDVFVAEVKRPGKFRGSPFYRRAKAHGFLPRAFSKYCVGCCLTHGPELRTNRFKPLLAQLGRVVSTGEAQQ
jgi:hypothetical protein